MSDTLYPYKQVEGRVRGYYCEDGTADEQLPEVSRPANEWTKNLVTFSWGDIIQKVLRGTGARINVMYLEYANSATPINPTPTYDRDSTHDYYAALSDPLDYLRVPLSTIVSRSSDPTVYPGHNVAEFWARSMGAAGVNGLPFSDSDDSIIYGGALVSAPNMDDPSQDMIFSRFYWAPAKQLPKLPNLQCVVRWPISFL
jgi:hypothetical protein